jgi:hypothetical protein
LIHGRDDTRAFYRDRSALGGRGAPADSTAGVGEFAAGIRMNLRDMMPVMQWAALSGDVKKNDEYSKCSDDQILHLSTSWMGMNASAMPPFGADKTSGLKWDDGRRCAAARRQPIRKRKLNVRLPTFGEHAVAGKQ